VLNNGIGRVPSVLKAGIGSELAALCTGALLLIALAAPTLGRTLSSWIQKHTLRFSSPENPRAN
jgi:hypothetical protein